MKTLVVYYSKTGKTKTAAKCMAEVFEADMEEISDLVKPNVAIACTKALFKKSSKIKVPEKFPKNYDCVVVCSPIWAGKIVPAVRAYMEQFGKDITVPIYVLTRGDAKNDYKNAFEDLDHMAAKKHIFAGSFCGGHPNLSELIISFGKATKEEISEVNTTNI